MRTSAEKRAATVAQSQRIKLRSMFTAGRMLAPENRQSLSFDPTPQASRDKTAKIQGRGW